MTGVFQLGSILKKRWGQLGERWRAPGRQLGGEPLRYNRGSVWGLSVGCSENCLGTVRGVVWVLFCGVVWGLLGRARDGRGVAGGVLHNPSLILLHPLVGGASKSATVSVTMKGRRSGWGMIFVVMGGAVKDMVGRQLGGTLGTDVDQFG